nr:MAG TPA: hypothetical protein [Bacteriophage sp.]
MMCNPYRAQPILSKQGKLSLAIRKSKHGA